MSQRDVAIGLLAAVVVGLGGLAVYDWKYGHKFQRAFGAPKPVAPGWAWSDDWKAKGDAPKPPGAAPMDPIEKSVTPPPAAPLVAGNYNEAVTKSKETGRPVLVFFTANWCSWCKKMRVETMPDPAVQAALKNYILVYLDSDQNRAVVSKFGVTSLPSYVITNGAEARLKSDAGYKSAAAFAGWLNDPALFAQPKTNPAR